jgi:hypothetical protein
MAQVRESIKQLILLQLLFISDFLDQVFLVAINSVLGRYESSKLPSGDFFL